MQDRSKRQPGGLFFVYDWPGLSIHAGVAHTESRSAVIKAIIGNAIITLAKGTATFFSGSGAMLAETIHSLVDTLNQSMLLIGHHRSQKKPTPRFPFGFSLEAHFWGLLAAIGVLIFGGALTIQHGIHAVMHPELPQNLPMALAVLGFSALIESYVMLSVFVEVRRARAGRAWGPYLRDLPPGTITVLLEDGTAVAGCLLAGGALAAAYFLQDGIYDAIAQLAIGGMLTIVGLYLIWRNRGSLIGRAIPADQLQRLETFMADLPGIDRVTAMRTRQLAADAFILKAEVVFSGGEMAGPILNDHSAAALQATDQIAMREKLGRFANDLFIEQARFVDELEERIRKKFPGAVLIDLEPHLSEDK